MDVGYGPFVDPELESLVERIHRPRVCIDNDSYQDCTLVKGLRLVIKSQNRSGVLSDVTRVFRESGLSIARAEIGIHGEKAVGSFHVTDVGGYEVVQTWLSQ